MERKGIYFNGNTKVINTPLFEDIFDSFTYEFWVRPEKPHTICIESTYGIKGIKGQRYVIGPGHGENPTRAGVGVSVGTNGISVFEHTHNHMPSPLVYVSPINDWIHVAIVYKNKTPLLYVNGELKKQGITSNKTVHASANIGGLFDYGYFVGQLDEIRIWDHPRSQSQIKYEMMKKLSENTPGLVFYQQDFVKNREKKLQPSHFVNDGKILLDRDKSKTKKVIVVIDRFVPHFDRDSGSRSIFHFLQFFLEIGLNVKFIGHDFTKHEPYTSHLQRLGIEVLHGPKYDKGNINQWIIDNGPYIDYFFINRPNIAIHYIDIIKNKTNAKIIYYGLDLHYLRLAREYELNPTQQLLNEVHYFSDIEKMILEKSDISYYPSIEEIRILDEKFPNEKKRAVPMFMFNHFPPKNIPDFSQKKDLIFVAGFDHRPNVDAVLWFCREVFPNVHTQIPEIKIFLVGANPSEKITSLKNSRIIVTGTVSELELNQYYQRSKIAVVPLRFGAGVKGKVLEAMYNGVPVVTTPIGAEGLFPDADIPITICNNPIEMANKIVSLYRENDVLSNLSIRSIQYIERHFSLENAKEILLQDFQTLNC